MHANEDGIACLNSLLRGELSATETYQQALAKLDKDPKAAELRRIHVEHREAANTLRQHVRDYGGKPDQGSGAWGAWAKMVEGTAKLLGEKAAIKALKEGEEKGISDYESALADTALPADCKALISSQLLPQTRAHVHSLDHIMSVS